MAITPEQCRAARILTQVDRALLAHTTGVPLERIADFETSGLIEPLDDMSRLQAGLERLGAKFIGNDAAGGVGVRLRFDADQTRRISAWESEGGRAAEDDVP